MSELYKSTAYRVALIYSAGLALAIILLGGAVYLAIHAALLSQLEERISNETLALAAEYQREGLVGLKEEIAEQESIGLAADLGYALFDASGAHIAGTMDTQRPLARGMQNIIFNDPQEGPDPARAQVSMLGEGLTLVVAADREPVEKIDATILSLLLVALAGVLVIGLAGGLLLGTYLRKRLGVINTAAQAIMGGDLNHRMALSGNNDEFDQLASTLNAMLNRICALMDNLRQVSSDVAHDLRTPLSHLHTRLEQALASEQDMPAMRKAVGAALVQTDELLALFAAILRISEIESGRIKQSFVHFKLSELVEELCQSFAPVFEDGGYTLSWAVEPDIGINGDRDLLAQTLINLLENTLKHTPAGSLISVELSRGPDSIRLVVADNGPGISAGDHERVTGRFTRLEQARSTPGNGLGLNLVRAIADLHHAQLLLSDRQPGLQVAINFPKDAPLCA